MRKVLTSGLLAVAVALTGLGCEDPPQPQTRQQKAKPPKPARKKAERPPNKKLTAEEKVKQIKDCWAAFNAQDVQKFGACYGPNTINEMVDYLPARTTKGPQALFAANAPVRKAFPDLKYELTKIFVRDNNAVVVYATYGTHKGELMGKEPTDKPIGYLSAHYLTWGADGLIKADRHYSDQGTFAGQLGFHEMPVRPALEAGKQGELEVVVAKKDEAEKENLARYRTIDKLGQDKDLGKMMEHYADDALFAYLAGPKDAKGTEEVKKTFDAWFKSSSDMKGTTEWAWAAGDYVLAAGRVSGTNDGDLGENTKATNKKFSMRGMDIVKFKDGKVVEHWMFGNGFKFAVDLGLAEDPAAMAQKDEADEGEDDPAEGEKKMAEDEGKEAPKSAPPAPPKDTKAAAKPQPPPPSKPKKSEDAYD